jgi:hypothetical protein
MFTDVIAGFRQDLSELMSGGPIGWLLLAALVLLPVVAVMLALAGSRLAFGSLAIWVALAAAWTTYYATDWWSNPGVGGSVALMALALLTGWILVVISTVRLLAARLVPARARLGAVEQ